MREMPPSAAPPARPRIREVAEAARERLGRMRSWRRLVVRVLVGTLVAAALGLWFAHAQDVAAARSSSPSGVAVEGRQWADLLFFFLLLLGVAGRSLLAVPAVTTTAAGDSARPWPRAVGAWLASWGTLAAVSAAVVPAMTVLAARVAYAPWQLVSVLVMLFVQLGVVTALGAAIAAGARNPAGARKATGCCSWR